MVSVSIKRVNTFVLKSLKHLSSLIDVTFLNLFVKFNNTSFDDKYVYGAPEYLMKKLGYQVPIHGLCNFELQNRYRSQINMERDSKGIKEVH